MTDFSVLLVYYFCLLCCD